MKPHEPYKRYMLFHYEQYYPCGGLGDCIGSLDTLEEVLNYEGSCGVDEVFDRVEGVTLGADVHLEMSRRRKKKES